MAANNQGIDHLRRPGFARGTLCKNERAHMAVSIEQHRAGLSANYCKRCLAKLAKMDDIIRRRQGL